MFTPANALRWVNHVLKPLSRQDYFSTLLKLSQFLEEIESDPIGFLKAEPLLRFQEENGDLPAGKLIVAYPPFCTKEASDGVSLAAIDASDLHGFHADVARQLPIEDSAFKMNIK